MAAYLKLTDVLPAGFYVSWNRMVIVADANGGKRPLRERMLIDPALDPSLEMHTKTANAALKTTDTVLKSERARIEALAIHVTTFFGGAYGPAQHAAADTFADLILQRVHRDAQPLPANGARDEKCDGPAALNAKVPPRKLGPASDPSNLAFFRVLESPAGAASACRQRRRRTCARPRTCFPLASKLLTVDPTRLGT